VEGGAAEDTSGIAEFDRALSWYVQGLDDQSLPAFQQLVARYPGSVAGRLALVAAGWNFERRKENDEFRAFLAAKTSASDTKLSGLAEYLLIGRLVKGGEYQEALAYSQKLVGRFPDSDLGKYALFEMAVIEWYYLKDQANGKSHFLEYIERYPNDALAVSAMVTLGMPIPEKEVGKNSPGAELATSELPYEYSFAPNYPNPFNPTTTLSFSLAEKGRVHIALYNLRGELVRSILDTEKEIGSHSITLDASFLPSGVYFCRMNCNDFTSNRKLTLLK
jgi:tetratricopeptide (TPR) repeat protein